MLIDNLNMRLQYLGGNQQQRMNRDKLYSLKKALLYSYQAATLVNEQGEEFRCLINPDKLKNDYDQKILSIPFEDICLNKERIGTTTEGLQSTHISTGQVFQWKENNTYWLIYLRNKEETAYFRAEIRRCKEEIEINGHRYKIYIRGPVETDIPWEQKKKKLWNTINYSLVIYVTKNEETLEFFHRFAKIKILGKPWEVTAIDTVAADDIIEVVLNETYSNPLEEEEGMPAVEIIKPENGAPYIEGDNFVGPYSVNTYKIVGLEPGGIWKKDSKDVQILQDRNGEVTVEILLGKPFNFNLSYTLDDTTVTFPIYVESF